MGKQLIHKEEVGSTNRGKDIYSRDTGERIYILDIKERG